MPCASSGIGGKDGDGVVVTEVELVTGGLEVDVTAGRTLSVAALESRVASTTAAVTPATRSNTRPETAAIMRPRRLRDVLYPSAAWFAGAPVGTVGDIDRSVSLSTLALTGPLPILEPHARQNLAPVWFSAPQVQTFIAILVIVPSASNLDNAITREL